jgi:hypothetical protein
MLLGKYYNLVNMDKKRRRRSRERSPEVKKVKGRGIRHSSGLKSWNTDFYENAKSSKKDDKSNKKNEEDWISNQLGQFESKSKGKNKKSSVWYHDKFERLIRSPNSEEEEEEINIVRESPTYMPDN